MTLFSLLSRSLPAIALAFAAFGVHAQDSYPSRPIKLIVPYTPGASTDSISRAFADEAGKALGQPMIVENKPGAGTAIGTQTAKQAPADGYTLLYASGAFISAMISLKTPGYSLSDFTPVVMLSSGTFVLMTPSALPANNPKEFVTYAKANPNKMNYAMLGAGSASHLLADRFQRAAKINWQDIGYKGGIPAVQAVMSNDVQGYFGTLTFARTYLQSDKIRLLAITAENRSPFLPDVPTFKEYGIDGVVHEDWSGLLIRSDTPAPIVEKLRTVFAKVMNSSAMEAFLQNNGITRYSGGLEDFKTAREKEAKEKAEEMEQLGITAQ